MQVIVPTLYFDLGSPYGYLATERAVSVLGRPPAFEPVLLGAIFKWRGWGSWAMTAERSERVRELEERARIYEVAPFVWPERWPANGLSAMRAATWAKQEGRAAEFARIVYERQFAAGADIADESVLAACAEAVDLDPTAMLSAIAAPEVKDELRRATRRAWELGVRGVPTIAIGDTLFYGDDRLEEAATALAP
jgi:2-hydroxychromene-2-carboxylate isomerase